MLFAWWAFGVGRPNGSNACGYGGRGLALASWRSRIVLGFDRINNATGGGRFASLRDAEKADAVAITRHADSQLIKFLAR